MILLRHASTRCLLGDWGKQASTILKLFGPSAFLALVELPMVQQQFIVLAFDLKGLAEA
jgi:hypothetical protein